MIENTRKILRFKKILAKLYKLRKRTEFTLDYVCDHYDLSDDGVFTTMNEKITKLLNIAINQSTPHDAHT